METKNILTSKTFWTNLIMLLSPLIPGVDAVLKANPEVMVGVITVVNIALRLISKDKVVLK